MDPIFIVVDLFCGAGGTTTGFAKAKMKPKDIFKCYKEFGAIAGFDDEFAKANFNKRMPVAKVIACVNHDPIAIKSHWENHKDVKHFEEDIRTLDLTELIELVKYYREKYPNAKLILWASLECTNFSKAKGGLPREADSRTLADHLDRYVLAIDPDYIQIENVVEFMSWGPLHPFTGKPISKRNGSDWLKWRERICSYGYYDSWKELNSADYGAYTSRNRLFGIFAKNGLPINWPEPTHTKTPANDSLFNPLKKWKPVKEVLDFSDEGNSIFGRKKDLSPKTYERIYAGLIKYVAGGKDAFMMKWNSMSQGGKHTPPDIEEPCPTISCQNRLGVAFIAKYYSGNPSGKCISVDGPAGTIKCSDGQSLILASFLTQYYGNGFNRSTNEPAPTVTTVDRSAIVNLVYLMNYHHSSDVNSVECPSPTLTTKDKLSVIKPMFIDKQYGGSDNHQSLEVPAGSLLVNDKHSLISGRYFVMNTNFNNNPTSIENPSWFGANSSIEAPSPVIIARQDKAPLYLINGETGKSSIIIYEEDLPIVKKIKEFMALYGIVDIKMRMLKVPELLRIQGFPKNYKLEGNQTDKKKFIGNSVVPDVVKHWTLAMAKPEIQMWYENYQLQTAI